MGTKIKTKVLMLLLLPTTISIITKVKRRNMEREIILIMNKCCRIIEVVTKDCLLDLLYKITSFTMRQQGITRTVILILINIIKKRE